MRPTMLLKTKGVKLIPKYDTSHHHGFDRCVTLATGLPQTTRHSKIYGKDTAPMDRTLTTDTWTDIPGAVAPAAFFSASSNNDLWTAGSSLA